MKTIVNFCGNCPFYVTNYDDFAVGKSTWYTCNLSQYLKEKEYFLPDEDTVNFDNLSSPDWCPLKKEEYSFEFKKFSTQRVQEIDKNDEEIKQLSDFFEMREDEADYDDPEFIKKSEQLTKLYYKSEELHNNEDLGFYSDDFQEDLNQKIEEIKEQLSALENAGSKLQETFSKLGVNEKNS